jgi:hypothetical protein
MILAGFRTMIAAGTGADWAQAVNEYAMRKQNCDRARDISLISSAADLAADYRTAAIYENIIFL